MLLDTDTRLTFVIHVASKIEESPRRPRDVINVFSHIRQVQLSST